MAIANTSLQKGGLALAADLRPPARVVAVPTIRLVRRRTHIDAGNGGIVVPVHHFDAHLLGACQQNVDVKVAGDLPACPLQRRRFDAETGRDDGVPDEAGVRTVPELANRPPIG